MPFTLSHASIFLPFHKISGKYISLTGLVVGSMSPDLEYFSRMKILATYGHDWLGALYFDLPLALVYCFAFHLLLRDILIEKLPMYFKSRLMKFTEFDWLNYFKKNWFVVIVSIIIGTYSHLIWDAFTHEWGFFVKQISLLKSVWFDVGYEVKGYKFLQHFSSVIGLLYIFYWIHKIPKSTIVNNSFDYQFWMKLIVFILTISVLRFVLFPIEIATGNLIVVPMMSGFMGLILAKIIQIVSNKKPQV
ncbi:DUF4184 family protein [Faecalibacter macacae]|uniref:DUF4184 family protein n=1 Tax=Faecalibacter macacae TaxID=1859289 RepID=A0A3L9M537_9FLAO|nr:DUF4184 family protein [Faecalibacter macacae]RLZ08317.1 DUF4184 family protein [Faecalibacter macacae]